MLKQIFETINLLRSQGLTVILAEQRVSEALSCCDRGVVVTHGEVVFRGTSNELLKDETINKAYFGS